MTLPNKRAFISNKRAPFPAAIISAPRMLDSKPSSRPTAPKHAYDPIGRLIGGVSKRPCPYIHLRVRVDWKLRNQFGHRSSAEAKGPERDSSTRIPFTKVDRKIFLEGIDAAYGL